MAKNSLVNVREIATHSSDHTYVLSCGGKLDRSVANMEGREELRVLDIVITFIRVDKEFSLPCRKLNLVLLTILKRQIQKTL